MSNGFQKDSPRSGTVAFACARWFHTLDLAALAPRLFTIRLLRVFLPDHGPPACSIVTFLLRPSVSVERICINVVAFHAVVQKLLTHTFNHVGRPSNVINRPNK